MFFTILALKAFELYRVNHSGYNDHHRHQKVDANEAHKRETHLRTSVCFDDKVSGEEC